MRKLPILLPLLLLWPSGYAHAQQSPAPNGEPYIRLDKTRFALGESVFFWIGVRRPKAPLTSETVLVPRLEPNRIAPIPKVYWSTCRLTITRPDGTKKVDRVGWPVDGSGEKGPGDRGWAGGWGLGATVGLAVTGGRALSGGRGPRPVF